MSSEEMNTRLTAAGGESLNQRKTGDNYSWGEEESRLGGPTFTKQYVDILTV